MRTSRIYIDPLEYGYLAPALASGSTTAVITLTGQTAHYLNTVLRLRPGDKVQLFDGSGSEFEAVLGQGSKRSLDVSLLGSHPGLPPSPCRITLIQAVSKGDRMDFAIQKATELGVHRIVPVLTARCDVKLDDTRQAKRLRHWQQIAISAAEQCGRSELPEIQPFTAFADCLRDIVGGFILHPADQEGIDRPTFDNTLSEASVMVGPEGGFTDREVEAAIQAGLNYWRLGPRILRTETAPLTALALLQWHYGDLAGKQV